MLQARIALVVIDGIERWLRGWSRGSADRAAADNVEQARAQDECLDDFLMAVSGLSKGTHLVLTTRALPAALRDVDVSFVPVDEEGRHFRLEGIDDDAAVGLLRGLGVSGADEEIVRVARQYENHPLALTVLGRVLAKSFGGRLERLDRVSALDPKDRLFELLEETRRNLPGRKRDEQILRVAALFVESPSLPALLAALGRPEGNAPALLERILTLAEWNLAEWDGSAELIRLHVLVKQFFATGPAGARPPGFYGLFTSLAQRFFARRVHRRLVRWYDSQSISPDAARVEDVRTRVLAIEHSLLAGQISHCTALVFGPMTSHYNFVEWCTAWGHHAFGSALLQRLAESSASAQDDQAGFLVARAALLRQSDRLLPAKESLDEAIALLDKVSRPAPGPRREMLSGALQNRGNVERQLEQFPEALRDLDRSLALLGNVSLNDPALVQYRAAALMNRGNILRDMGHLGRAARDIGEAISLCRHVIEMGRTDVEPVLASAHANRGNVYSDSLDLLKARPDFDEAELLHRRFCERGRPELEARWAQTLVMRGSMLVENGEPSGGLADIDHALPLITRHVETGRHDLGTIRRRPGSAAGLRASSLAGGSRLSQLTIPQRGATAS